jgi:hypothetical protein
VAAAGRGDGVVGVIWVTRVHEQNSVGKLELYGERRESETDILIARK